MSLLQDIETVKNDINGVLKIDSEQVALSQKELLLFGLLRLILGGIGGTGGDGSVSIDNEALAGAIANALELKILTVAGDTVNETVLASAIAANTQPISASSLPLPTDAATETTLSSLSAKLPSSLISDRLSVDGSGVTQPVSASSLPLPTGAATEVTLSGLSAKLPSALVSGRLSVDGSAVTQPISATSLPLPSGASTETTLAALSAKLPSVLVTDRLKVDGSGVTQPVSAASLPLPTGAATSAKQPALGTAGTPSTDVITVQGITNGVAQPISAASLPLPAGASTEATLSALSAKLPSTLATDRLKVDGSGVTQPVSASSLPLPTGAATETTLSGLSAKLPSALVSGRLSVDGSAVTQPVSASSLPLPTGAATSAKQPALGTAGTPSTDVITVQGITNGVAQPISAASLPLPAGAATETTLSGLSAKLPSALVSGRLSVDGSGVTQPVSAASLPLPTGAATSAKQPALGTAGTPSTDVISVQGVASGTPLPASQSGTWQLRLQDGSGNAITSQVSGAQRAVDTQILLSGSVIDPRSIRALTSADIVSFVAISKRVSATFTRPADTTAYAAGDAMGSSTSTPTILTFANSARISAGTGIITKARLVKNSTTTTNAAFRLWLFSSSPTGANDNAAFTLSYSSAGSRLGYIDFPDFVTEGASSDCVECEVIGLASQFYAAATSLFGVLVARAAYTPTSGEQFFVELALEQN